MRPFPLIAFVLVLSACASQHDHLEPPRGGFRGQDGRAAHGGPGRPSGPGGSRALFISPMGEPFRVERPDHAWFVGADQDGDGRLSPAEFRADAARFFKVLDRGGDGEIDPGDVEFYENQLVPEVRVGGGGPGTCGRDAGERGRADRGDRGGPGGGGPGGGSMGGGGPGGRGRGGRPGDGSDSGTSGAAAIGREGAARFSYLNLPEPVTPADRNFNRGIDADEWARAADEQFALLDRNHDGVLTPGELPSVNTRTRGGPGGPRGKLGGSPPPADDRDN